MIKVLVVDDDSGLRLSVKNTLLSTNNYSVDEAFDGVSAVEKVKEHQYNIVLMDVDMPRMSGLEALTEIKKHDPSIIVIIMTAYANINDAVLAVKEGAFNYVSKPVESEQLIAMINKSLAAYNMISDIAASAPTLAMDSGRKIIGNTTQMKKVFNIINKLSNVNTPVLIRGASGTGKELVARAIHLNSTYKDGPFLAINCSAIPENLFESELFGHEKGSFTGADVRKIGKFQHAEGGTLFLDELGDMPILMQVKLLRVLQEKVFTPVGSNREIKSNVRIIAATNRPLEEMMKTGEFREDLYYRLNVMPILLPKLEERVKDIQHIALSFVKKFNKRHKCSITSISPEAMNCLMKYSWPGNIRELENVIEHAFILEEGSQIQLSSLPENILNSVGIQLNTLNNDHSDSTNNVDPSEDLITISGEDLDFTMHKEAFEKQFIVQALTRFKGKINQTAIRAKIPKKTLLRKIEKYQLVPKDYSEK